MARAASPELAYQIGQHFKENKFKNEIDGGNRPEEQSVNHLLAHAVLGAAVSAATGNDIATGALAGASSEYTAPILATYLYGKDPKELTQEQKDTITSVLNLATVTTAYTATDGSTADAVSAAEVGKVGVEWNYLSRGQEEIHLRRATPLVELKALSQKNEDNLKKVCVEDPSSYACTKAIQDSLWYNSQSYLRGQIGDGKQSSTNVLKILYYGNNAQNLFSKRVSNIDHRANFFGTNDRYYKYNNIDIRWFGGAEKVSRECWVGLGADGCASWLTFAFPGMISQVDMTPGTLYQWRAEAGNAIMEKGFENFKEAFQGSYISPKQWDIKQLDDEQKILQPVHWKYLKNRLVFVGLTKYMTNYDSYFSLIKKSQRIPGGVNLLDTESRIKYGCHILGYTEAQGCKLK